MMRFLAPLVLAVAAIFEVAGDVLIRKGLRGQGMAITALGFIVLGSYGVVVNLLPFDFSRLLGAYVGVFALVSLAAGRLVFGETLPVPTLIGLALILAGSAVIQFVGS